MSFVMPQSEYRKSKDNKRAFIKSTSYATNRDGTKKVKPGVPNPRVSYSEFDKKTKVCSLRITKEVFDSGIEITEQEFRKLLDFIKSQ